MYKEYVNALSVGQIMTFQNQSFVIGSIQNIRCIYKVVLVYQNL